MNIYQHVLVGLDLSEDSESVLAKAYALSQGCDARLSVAHIIEPLAFAYGGDVPVDLSEAQSIMEEQARKRLRHISEAHGIPENQQHVCLGQTSTELHVLADEQDADLIVVGSHGRHGLALILGSTAGGVLKGAQCDVLAVRV